MFETAILILLYNKDVFDSQTIMSLIESKIQYSNTRLIIWNNGPELLQCIDLYPIIKLGYDVVIVETINNESLAVIYNKFLHQNKAKKYIFFDDDSILNESYILASSNTSPSKVNMPIIKVNNKVQYPIVDGTPYLPNSGITSKNKIITVGSGLIIGSDIITILKDQYKSVFDERFYLYGVDMTFCLRLISCNLAGKIEIIPGFNHSLSRLEDESPKKTKFRQLERSYDIGLRLKYYYPFHIAMIKILRASIGIFHKILFKQSKRLYFFSLLKAFILGKHYRDI